MIVDDVDYKDWSFSLDNYARPGECEGLTLRIRFPERDTYNTEGPLVFWVHEFDVPARICDDETWTHWVFDCMMLAEKHEAMEQFFVAGERVFAPEHEVTRDLYNVKHVTHRIAIGD
jgi:hypothetical protein